MREDQPDPRMLGSECRQRVHADDATVLWNSGSHTPIKGLKDIGVGRRWIGAPAPAGIVLEAVLAPLRHEDIAVARSRCRCRVGHPLAPLLDSADLEVTLLRR